MKSKQQQQLQELQKKSRELESPNARVENLKRQLKLLTDNYYRRAYEILKEIIAIRKTQIKYYRVGSLAKEKGLGLTGNQIAYIFGFEYLSKRTEMLIEKNLLKTQTALYIVRQDMRYRDPQIQDKVIQRYLDGELKVDDISRLKEQLIFDKVNYKEEEIIADKNLQSYHWQLQEMIRTVKSKSNLFTSVSLLNICIHEAEKLVRELELVKKFGKRIRR